MQHSVGILSHFNKCMEVRLAGTGFREKSKFKMETQVYIFPLIVANPIL